MYIYLSLSPGVARHKITVKWCLLFEFTCVCGGGGGGGVLMGRQHLNNNDIA